jgi:hypothetical protein
MRLIALVVVLLAGSFERAEACACCDAGASRSVVGWSDPEGEVMIEYGHNYACTPHHTLEVWKIGAAEPSACYDLYQEPDKRISCNDVIGSGGTPPGTKPKPSKARAAFRRKARTIPTVVTARWDGGGKQALVTVKIAGKRVLSERFVAVRGEPSPDVSVQALPTPNGKRALLFVHYRDAGSNNAHVDVRWVALD